MKKRKKRKELDYKTRLAIAKYLNDGLNIIQISKILGRDDAVLYREVNKRSVDGVYNPLLAEEDAIKSRSISDEQVAKRRRLNDETKYLYASRLNTRKSNVVCNEIINIMKPLLPKSITMDRGKEFALFEQIEDELNCSIYFSDLGCPYQRGSIENANGLLRQYYPKGTDFANITQKSLDEAVKQINARPRMIFDYKSSEEMLKYHVSTQNCEPILNDCVRHEPVN